MRSARRTCSSDSTTSCYTNTSEFPTSRPARGSRRFTEMPVVRPERMHLLIPFMLLITTAAVIAVVVLIAAVGKRRARQRSATPGDGGVVHGGESTVDTLGKLPGLHWQGILSDEKFSAQYCRPNARLVNRQEEPRASSDARPFLYFWTAATRVGLSPSLASLGLKVS